MYLYRNLFLYNLYFYKSRYPYFSENRDADWQQWAGEFHLCVSVSVCVCGAVLCLCEECVSGWVRRTDDGSHLGRPTWPTAVMEMHNCDHGDGKPGRRARVIMRF